MIIIFLVNHLIFEKVFLIHLYFFFIFYIDEFYFLKKYLISNNIFNVSNLA